MKHKIMTSFMLITMFSPYILPVNQSIYAETVDSRSVQGTESDVTNLLNSESKKTTTTTSSDRKPTSDISELLEDQKKQTNKIQDEVPPNSSLAEEPDAFKEWEEEVTSTETSEETEAPDSEIEDLLNKEEKTSKKSEEKQTEEKKNSERQDERAVSTWEAFVADMEAGKDIELTSDITATSNAVIKLPKSLTVSSEGDQRFKIDFKESQIIYQADDINLTLKNIEFTTSGSTDYETQKRFLQPAETLELSNSSIILDHSKYETALFKFSQAIDVIVQNDSEFISTDERKGTTAMGGGSGGNQDMSKATGNKQHPLNIDRLEVIDSKMDVSTRGFFVSRNNKDNTIRFINSDVKINVTKTSYTGDGSATHMFLLYSKTKWETINSNVYLNDHTADGKHGYNPGSTQATIQMMQTTRDEKDIVSGSRILIDKNSNFLMHGGRVSAFWSAQDDTEFKVKGESVFKFERFGSSTYGSVAHNHRVANTNMAFSGTTANLDIEENSKFYLLVDKSKFKTDEYGGQNKANLASNIYTGDTNLTINVIGNSYASFENKGMKSADGGASFYTQKGRYPMSVDTSASKDKQYLKINISDGPKSSNPENPEDPNAYPIDDNSSMDVDVENHPMVRTLPNLEIDMNEGAIINWVGQFGDPLIQTSNKRIIKMDKVAYFNFVNRTIGKTLFSGGAAAENYSMESINNPIASWKTGAANDETTTPTHANPKLDFTLNGGTYANIVSTSPGSGEEFNEYYTKVKGFSNVNRIKMDNFKSIYIPDQAVYPTDQDSKVYITPMVATENPDEPRLPNKNEVYASIEIQDEAGKTLEVVEGGKENKKSNPEVTDYPVYNEEKNITEMVPRKGLIEFTPKIKLEAGMYVKVTSLQRGPDIGVNGNENEPIETDVRTIPRLKVQDITPPEPAKIPSKEDDSTKFISKRNKSISGQAEEPSKVSLVKNGVPVEGISTETSGDNNDFTIDLPTDLKPGDKIRVVLEDKSLMDKISVLNDPNEPTSGKKEIEVIKDAPKRSHEFEKGNHNPYPNDKQEGGSEAELDKLRIDYHDATNDKRFKLARVLEVQGMLEFTAPSYLNFGKNIKVSFADPLKDYPALEWGEAEGTESSLAVFDDRINSENKWKISARMDPEKTENQQPEADLFYQGLKYRNASGDDQTLQGGASALILSGQKDQNISDTWFKGSRDEETGEVTGNNKKAGFILSLDGNQITNGQHKNSITWTLEDAP